MPVTVATVFGQPRYSESAYMLLYQQAGAGDERPPALSALPGQLQEAVSRDNATYRRERHGRPVGTPPPVQYRRPPPPRRTGCGDNDGFSHYR